MSEEDGITRTSGVSFPFRRRAKRGGHFRWFPWGLCVRIFCDPSQIRFPHLDPPGGKPYTGVSMPPIPKDSPRSLVSCRGRLPVRKQSASAGVVCEGRRRNTGTGRIWDGSGRARGSNIRSTMESEIFTEKKYNVSLLFANRPLH